MKHLPSMLRHPVLIAGCLAATLAPLPAAALNVYLYANPTVCSYAVGSIDANILGGVPPYIVTWTGPGGFSSPFISISGLNTGTYVITVADDVGTIVTDSAEVIAGNYDIWMPMNQSGFCPGTGPWGAYSQEIGFASMNFFPPEPVVINSSFTMAVWDGGGGYDYIFFPPVPAGAPYTVAFEDVNGCPGVLHGDANHEVVWPSLAVISVEGSCSSGPNGAVLVAAGAEPHAYPILLRLKTALGQFVEQQWYGWSPLTLTFDGLAPGDYRLVRGLNNSPDYPNSFCIDSIPFTIPDLGPACGNVSGTLFMDYDENCAINSGEPGVPSTILQFTPGPFYTTTGSGGSYSINLSTGTYQVDQLVTDIAPFCPVPPASVTVTGLHTLNLGDTSLVPLDATVAIACGAARPGFVLSYAIDLDNLTPATTGANTLVMTFDPAVGFYNAFPTPFSVVGSTITWNLAALAAFGHADIAVNLQVPPNLGMVGSVLNATVVLTTTNTDAVPANNSVSTAVTVTASVDPNDKSVLTSTRWSGSQYFIGDDQWLDYTIRFQNTGTDTAFNVIVTDTLDADLDPATIQWGAASHTCNRQLEGSGVVKFIFGNILLPDSNHSEANSHGFVSFRIRPDGPVLPGTVLSNAADIFFDFNPPVHTNDAVVVAESSTAVHEHGQEQLLLFPNPANDRAICMLPVGELPLQWNISSMDGRILLSTPVRGNGHETIILDLRLLNAGAYLVEVTTLSGKKLLSRLLKP